MRTLGGAAVVATLFVPLLPAVAGEEEPRPGSIAGRVDSPWVRRIEGAVYVERIEGGKFDPPKEAAVMDQKDLVFVPHVLPVLVGTTVRFPNSDTVRHNVLSPKGSPKVFNLGTYDAGEAKEVVFETPGVVPLLCNVHSEMSAFVLVLETPWFARTDRTGGFQIEGVPPGTYRLTAWHEKLKPLTKDVKVEAGKTAEVVFEKLEKR